MRKILTVRVTAIEAFRFWMYNQSEQNEMYINEENVLSTIRGEERFNIKASFGSAGHSLIENAERYKVRTEEQTFTTIASASDVMPELEDTYQYRVDEFVFSEEQVMPMLKFREEHPLMTREQALSKVYRTRHFDLIVTGSCDHLEGVIVRDTKFKFSNFDLTDFISSIQWRLYLDMLGLKTFYYDFFNVRGFETMADCNKARISECESMMLRAYPTMGEYIDTVLNEFMDWIVAKDMVSHLEITTAKKARILRGDPALKKLIAA